MRVSFPKIRAVRIFHPLFVTFLDTFAARNHPAADRDMPPVSLIRYHPDSRPHPFTSLEFYDSMIGHGMRSFNSLDGVSSDAWHLLHTSSVFCPGCNHMFSVDGFQAHTRGGKCPKPGARFSVAPSHSESNLHLTCHAIILITFYQSLVILPLIVTNPPQHLLNTILLPTLHLRRTILKTL